MMTIPSKRSIHDLNQIIEEPCEVKVSCTVLKTSRMGDCPAEFNNPRRKMFGASQPVDEVSGVEYQRGELFGFEVKEYLLAKWGRNCVYCGTENIPLEVEHIIPKSKGGSNRVSNLTLACRCCNRKKGNDPIEKFLKKKQEVLRNVLAQAKAPLKDAAAVNATRWELFSYVQQTELPVETGSGGLTKFNRKTKGIDKTHWTDAACVGKSTHDKLLLNGVKPLTVKAKGHGIRQRCRPDQYGFPRGTAPKAKFFMGFQTGDIVKANIPKGKYAGQYIGRIAIRYRPSFVLQLQSQIFGMYIPNICKQFSGLTAMNTKLINAVALSRSIFVGGNSSPAQTDVDNGSPRTASSDGG